MSSKFLLASISERESIEARSQLLCLAQNSKFFLLGQQPALSFTRNGDSYVIFGDSKLASSDIGSFFSPTDSTSIDARFVVFQLRASGGFSVWADRFGRMDVYYQQNQHGPFFSSGLDLLPVWNDQSAELDDVGLMQSMCIYGSRPAKRHTWFSEVKRLGVGDCASFSVPGAIDIVKHENNHKFDFPSDEKLGLNAYSDFFIEAVRSRASAAGNIVFLSSGWDSTSILATLVHLFGKGKVKAVIGRMLYSTRSGVCNSFEVERAIKFCNYFDVKLHVIDLDYRSGSDDLFSRLEGVYRPQHFCNLTGWNHWLLAEAAAKVASGGEAVFVGEMSDGAHNFGFSQYATIFHPSSYDFREYSDKMAGYLFGPTFLNTLLKGEQDNDPVWNLFKDRNGLDFFETPGNDEYQIKSQFLKSFFLRSGRIPLAKNKSRLLTETGKLKFDQVSFECYLAAAAATLSSDNLYQTLIDLYNSFHWQGSTVSTAYHAIEASGLTAALPFHDFELIGLLSKMPESYGRGLELRPTKYPLKWMLENRIDYPMEMQRGAHSYTYDVDPTFSHLDELVNHSSLRPLFENSLRSRHYRNIYKGDSFDMDFIDKQVEGYLRGHSVGDQDLGLISNLALHSLLSPV